MRSEGEACCAGFWARRIARELVIAGYGHANDKLAGASVNSKLEGGLDLGTGLRGRVRFEIRLGHVTGARSRNVTEASES